MGDKLDHQQIDGALNKLGVELAELVDGMMSRVIRRKQTNAKRNERR